MTARRIPLAPDDPRHGSANGYNNHGCRCAACTAAWATAHAQYMRRKPAQQKKNSSRFKTWHEVQVKTPIPPEAHGTASGYRRYRCHCERCMAAIHAYREDWIARSDSPTARKLRS